MSSSPRVLQIKKVKKRLKDYLDKCSVEELIALAESTKVKVPNQLRMSIENKK